MAAQPSTPASMYKRVIKETMDEEGIDADEIPIEEEFDIDNMEDILRGRSLRYHRTKGFARFYCLCRRKWGSAHAWCILDLRKQSVAHQFRQKCQGCESEAQPVFDEESMKRMARYAVDRYLIKTGRLRRPPRNDDKDRDAAEREEDERPHDEERCDMCIKIGGSCWKSRRAVPLDDSPVAVRPAVHRRAVPLDDSPVAVRPAVHRRAVQLDDSPVAVRPVVHRRAVPLDDSPVAVRPVVHRRAVPLDDNHVTVRPAVNRMGAFSLSSRFARLRI